MPRGKRTKKTSGLNKGLVKSTPFAPIPGNYPDQVNGIVLKREPINGEGDVYQGELFIEREINELINGNVDGRQEYLGGDDHHHRNNNFDGRAVATEPYRALVNGTSAPTDRVQPKQEMYMDGPESRDAPLSNYPGYESDEGLYPNEAEACKEILSELADTPNGTLQTTQIAKRIGFSTKKDLNLTLYTMQRAGLVERVRDIPPHWQLTPIGRGRVASGSSGDSNTSDRERVSPAPERIQTGFNERSGNEGKTLCIVSYGRPSFLRSVIALTLHHTPNFNPRCAIYSAPQQS